MKINPADYEKGTIGSLAPDITNPTNPMNNPFNPQKNLSFYEVEVNVGSSDNPPTVKPGVVENPGNIPSGFSLGVKELEKFVSPEPVRGQQNDLFPQFDEVKLSSAPIPRETAITVDFDKTIGAIPEYVLHPIDKAKQATDGPGYTDGNFSSTAPVAPNSITHPWTDRSKCGLSDREIEWLTFKTYDKYFREFDDFLKGTELLNQSMSMNSQLSNNNLVAAVKEDFERALVFPPNANWKKLCQKVNYELISSWGANLAVKDEETGEELTIVQFLSKSIRSSASVLFLKDKISQLGEYSERKVLYQLFLEKDEDKRSLAEKLFNEGVDEAIRIAVHCVNNSDTNDNQVIKNYLNGALVSYLNGGENTTEDSENISQKITKFIDQLADDNKLLETDRNQLEKDVKQSLANIMVDVIGDQVIDQVRRLKLQLQLDAIERDSSADKDALNYLHSRMVLLKNEVTIPAEITQDIVIAGMPVNVGSEEFKKITSYLNGNRFLLDKYAKNLLEADISSAVQGSIKSCLSDENIRSASDIKLTAQNQDEQIKDYTQKEDIRYLLSDQFREILSTYISKKILGDVDEESNNSAPKGTIIHSVVNELDIDTDSLATWIRQAVDDFCKDPEIQEQFPELQDVTFLNVTKTIIQELLFPSLKENQWDDSLIVKSVKQYLTEQTPMTVKKNRVEDQLQVIKSILTDPETEEKIEGVDTASGNGELFLEYCYAKILKDHYEPLVFNDVIFCAQKLSSSWFNFSQNHSQACLQLQAYIESVRKNYGSFYESLQTFPNQGKSYKDETGEKKRYPELKNQYDLFKDFFDRDQKNLNIDTILAQYNAVYLQYGEKCYSTYEKYNISDYCKELEKLQETLSKNSDLSDVLSNVVRNSIEQERVALKNELEAIEKYILYIKADAFRQELNDFLLDASVEGWRDNDSKRQVLENAIRRIAVDHGIMRITQNGLYGSATLSNTNEVDVIYDDNASDYLYVLNILKTVEIYKTEFAEKDIYPLVAEIVKTVEAYQQEDLYLNEDFLSQFSELLNSPERLDFDERKQLFAFLTKYVPGDKVDLSLTTLFSEVMPWFKNGEYSLPAIKNLVDSINRSAAEGLRTQISDIYKNILKDNDALKVLSSSKEADKFANYVDSLQTCNENSDLGVDKKQFYVDLVTSFTDIYNQVIKGIKEQEANIKALDFEKNSEAQPQDKEKLKTQLQEILKACKMLLDNIQAKSKTGDRAEIRSFNQALGDLRGYVEIFGSVCILNVAQTLYPDWDKTEKVLEKLISFLEDDRNIINLNSVTIFNFIKNLKDRNLVTSVVDQLKLREIFPLSEEYHSDEILKNFKKLEESLSGHDFNSKTYYNEMSEQFSSFSRSLNKLFTLDSVQEGANEIGESNLVKLNEATESNHTVFINNHIVEVYEYVLESLKNELSSDGTFTSGVTSYSEYSSEEARSILENFNSLRRKIDELSEYIESQKLKTNTSVGKDTLSSEEITIGNNILTHIQKNLRQNQYTFLREVLDKIFPNWNSERDQYESLKDFLEESKSTNSDIGVSEISNEDYDKIITGVSSAAYLENSNSQYSYENIRNDIKNVEGKLENSLLRQLNSVDFYTTKGDITSIVEQYDSLFSEGFKTQLSEKIDREDIDFKEKILFSPREINEVNYPYVWLSNLATTAYNDIGNFLLSKNSSVSNFFSVLKEGVKKISDNEKILSDSGASDDLKIKAKESIINEQKKIEGLFIKNGGLRTHFNGKVNNISKEIAAIEKFITEGVVNAPVELSFVGNTFSAEKENEEKLKIRSEGNVFDCQLSDLRNLVALLETCKVTYMKFSNQVLVKICEELYPFNEENEASRIENIQKARSFINLTHIDDTRLLGCSTEELNELKKLFLNLEYYQADAFASNLFKSIYNFDDALISDDDKLDLEGNEECLRYVDILCRYLKENGTDFSGKISATELDNLNASKDWTWSEITGAYQATFSGKNQSAICFQILEKLDEIESEEFSTKNIEDLKKVLCGDKGIQGDFAENNLSTFYESLDGINDVSEKNNFSEIFQQANVQNYSFDDELFEKQKIIAKDCSNLKLVIDNAEKAHSFLERFISSMESLGEQAYSSSQLDISTVGFDFFERDLVELPKGFNSDTTLMMSFAEAYNTLVENIINSANDSNENKLWYVFQTAFNKYVQEQKSGIPSDDSFKECIQSFNELKTFIAEELDKFNLSRIVNNQINGQDLGFELKEGTEEAYNNYFDIVSKNLWKMMAMVYLALYAKKENIPSSKSAWIEMDHVLRDLIQHYLSQEDFDNYKTKTSESLATLRPDVQLKLSEIFEQTQLKDVAVDHDFQSEINAIQSKLDDSSGDYLLSNVIKENIKSINAFIEQFYTKLGHGKIENGKIQFDSIKINEAVLYSGDENQEGYKDLFTLINFEKTINSKIKTINEGLEGFSSEDKVKADNINKAIEDIVESFSEINQEGLLQTTILAIQDLVNFFKELQPQLYVTLLEKLYPNISSSSGVNDIENFRKAINGVTFIADEKESLSARIKEQVNEILDGISNYTLIDYLPTEIDGAFPGTSEFIKNITSFNTVIQRDATVQDPDVQEILSNFTEVNKLLNNVLTAYNKDGTTSLLEQAVAALQELEVKDIPAEVSGDKLTLMEKYRAFVEAFKSGDVYNALVTFSKAPGNEDNYDNIASAIKGLIDGLASITGIGTGLQSYLKAFNAGLLMLYLQYRFANWDKNEGEDLVSSLKGAFNQKFEANEEYLYFGDNGKNILDRKIQNYSGDLKILNEKLHYVDSDGNIHEVNSSTNWFYIQKDALRGSIQYEVDPKNQYVEVNGQYALLAEEGVAFVAQAPDRHIRILAPELRYKKNQEGQFELLSKDSSPAETDIYVLGEDDIYYPVSDKYGNNQLLCKLVDGDGKVSYASFDKTRTIYYKSINQGYFGVAAENIPSYVSQKDNGEDYYLYNEGSYYKVDDLYTRYIPVDGTYYRVLREDTQAQGDDIQFTLENGTKIAANQRAVCYYRSTQGTSKFFGSQLYQWELSTKYVTKDQIVIPVTYDRYILNSKSGVKGFEQQGSSLYAKNSTGQYTEIGNINEKFFESDQGNQRIEFPSRKYAQGPDGMYYYVPNPEIKYEKIREPIGNDSEILNVGGQFINASEEYAGFNEIVTGSFNGYIQASDGGYYPTEALQIKLKDGTELKYADAEFKTSSEEPINVTNWKLHSLNRISSDSIYVITDNEILEKASQNKGGAEDFYSVTREDTGEYILADDKKFYSLSNLKTGSNKILADFDINTDQCDFYVSSDSKKFTLVPNGEIVDCYACRDGSYYKIQQCTTVSGSLIDINGKKLLPGQSYIEKDSKNVRISSDDIHYIQVGSKYIPISGSNAVEIKKLIKNPDQGLISYSGLTIVNDQNGGEFEVISKVKTTDRYSCHLVSVETDQGSLQPLSELKVTSGGVSVDAIDGTGKSNIYVKNDKNFVRVNSPEEPYEVHRSDTGSFIKIGARYYDKNDKKITLNLRYIDKYGNEQDCKLADNDPNTKYYLMNDPVSSSTGVSGNTIAVGTIERPIQAVDICKVKTISEKTDVPTDPNSEKNCCVQVGEAYYSLEDYDLCIKKNGKLSLYAGNVESLKSENGIYMAPYLIEKGTIGEANPTNAIKVTGCDYGSGKISYFSLEEKSLSGPLYATCNTEDGFVKANNNAYYSCQKLKVQVGDEFCKFVGISYTKDGEYSSNMVSENVFETYEFSMKSSEQLSIDSNTFLKGTDGSYYILKDESGSLLYAGAEDSAVLLPGDSYSFIANGKNVMAMSAYIVASEDNFGDCLQIKDGEQIRYIKKNSLRVNDQEIEKFFVKSYENVDVLDLSKTYEKVDNQLNYVRGDSGKETDGFFAKGNIVNIPGDTSLYQESVEGNFVRAETEGYFKYAEVKNDPNFIKQKDVYFKKTGEDVYTVTGLTTEEVYVYGKKYNFIDISNGLYYKHEGDFATRQDDIYAKTSSAKVQGIDELLYNEEDLYVFGEQSEFIPWKDLIMLAENDIQANANSVYVKSFRQINEDISNKISDDQMYEDLGDTIEQYLNKITKDLADFGEDVSYHNQSTEAINYQLQLHSDWKKEGGTLLASDLDETAARFDRLGNDNIGSVKWQQENASIWETYIRSLRDEVDSYTISSEEQNLYEQRLAQINTKIVDSFGSIISHEILFGGDLSLIVRRLISKIDAKDETQKYEEAYTIYREFVDNLRVLHESWVNEDAEKESVSDEMKSLVLYLSEVVNKFQAVTYEQFLKIIPDSEIFAQTTMLEYIYNNYGQTNPEIIYLKTTDNWIPYSNKITLQIKTMGSRDNDVDQYQVLRLNDGITKTEFLYRYNVIHDCIEKAIVLGNFDESQKIENYTWVKARSETDLEAWDLQGLLFKDIIRHNSLQRLFRTTNDNQEKVLGEIAQFADDKLNHSGYMYQYIEQLNSMLEVPMYLAGKHLKFFPEEAIEMPALLETISGTTTSLASKPEANPGPLETIEISFRDQTGLTSDLLHETNTVKNFHGDPVISMGDWPKDSDENPLRKIELGNLVSYLLDTKLKTDGNTSMLCLSTISGNGYDAIKSKVIDASGNFKKTTDAANQKYLSNLNNAVANEKITKGSPYFNVEEIVQKDWSSTPSLPIFPVYDYKTGELEPDARYGTENGSIPYYCPLLFLWKNLAESDRNYYHSIQTKGDYSRDFYGDESTLERKQAVVTAGLIFSHFRKQAKKFDIDSQNIDNLRLMKGKDDTYSGDGYGVCIKAVADCDGKGKGGDYDEWVFCDAAYKNNLTHTAFHYATWISSLFHGSNHKDPNYIKRTNEELGKKIDKSFSQQEVDRAIKLEKLLNEWCKIARKELTELRTSRQDLIKAYSSGTGDQVTHINQLIDYMTKGDWDSFYNYVKNNDADITVEKIQSLSTLRDWMDQDNVNSPGGYKKIAEDLKPAIPQLKKLGGSELKNFIDSVSDYEKASAAEKGQKSEVVLSTSRKLLEVIEAILIDLSAYDISSTYPVCSGVCKALSQLKTNVELVKDAATAARKEAQSQLLLTELNKLESAYKNWRTDSVEHQGMISALKEFKDGERRQSFDEIQDIIEKVYKFVDKYKVNGSLYSIWKNGSYTDKVNIADDLKKLQSKYSKWTSQESAREALHTELEGRINNSRNSNEISAYKEILNVVNAYNVKTFSTVPHRLNLSVSGTTDDFKGLNSVTTATETYLESVLEVSKINPFQEPARGTVPSTVWNNVKSTMNSLDSVGEDDLKTYLTKQSEGLSALYNEENKQGFYKISKLLDEIIAKIKQFTDLYSREQSVDHLNSALSMAKWYNQIVDFAAQYLTVDLQKYINRCFTSKEWNPPQEGTDSCWDVSNEKSSRLKYIEVDVHGTIKFTEDLNSLSKSKELGKLLKLLNDYSAKTFLTQTEVNWIQNYQAQVLNLVNQYNALSEVDKDGYDSTNVRLCISQLRNYITNNIYNYEETDLGEVKVIKGSDLPSEMQSLYKNYLDSLINLSNAFESRKIEAEISKFYNWFTKVETLYPDWRINSVSRKSLKDQLAMMRSTVLEMELPKAISNEKEVLPSNILIRTSGDLREFVKQAGSVMKNLQSLLKDLKEEEKQLNTVQSSISKTINGELNFVEELLNKSKNNGEFRAADDYVSCQEVVTSLKDLTDEVLKAKNAKNVDNWLERVVGGTFQSLIFTSNLYFSQKIVDHIRKIENFIGQYDIDLEISGSYKSVEHDKQTENWQTKVYQNIASIYGFTGDCDNDQVAIIRLIEKMRVAIEDEYADLQDSTKDIGGNLLSAKITGENISLPVRDILKSTERYKQYYQAWLDFERYSSWLAMSFISRNQDNRYHDESSIFDLPYKKGQNPAIIFDDILRGKDNNCKDLFDLITKYEKLGDVYKELYNGLEGYRGLKDMGLQFTVIDYTESKKNDLELDAFKCYRDLFIEENSTFAYIRKYLEGQSSYTAVNDYIAYLFNKYPDWRGNTVQNENLRERLSELKTSQLYEQSDLSWVIASDERLSKTEKDTAKSKKINKSDTLPKDIKVNMGDNQFENPSMEDYIGLLLDGIYGYDTNLDKGAIYEKRQVSLTEVVQENLGQDYDYSAIMGTSKESLLVGSSKIKDRDVLSKLIKDLEAKVKIWNREDETIYKSVFDSMNKNGTYMLQEDGSYVFQESVQLPLKNGTIKEVNDDWTTIKVYKDETIVSEQRIETVRNRIMTNEVLAVIDELKDIYVNSDAYFISKESYYRLQMAEYIYGIVGNEMSELTWHAPTNGTDSSLLLSTQGCYTFRLDSKNHSGYYICGMVNGEIKISYIDRESSSDAIVAEIETMTVSDFEKLKDLQGVYFAKDTSGNISTLEMKLSANGHTYISIGGKIVDDEGNVVSTDSDGFLVDSNSKRIIATRTSDTSTSYIAYRIDVNSNSIVGVLYNVEEGEEIAADDGNGALESHTPLFSEYMGLFHPQSQYLLDESLKKSFYDELSKIGISFESQYKIWQQSADDPLFEDAAGSIRVKMANYADYFSKISGAISFHDVLRYNDLLSYYGEQQMISLVNQSLKSLNADGDLKNFANLSEKAKELNEKMYQLVLAKSKNDIEASEKYLEEFTALEVEYQNAKNNAANGKGNFEAYVISLNKTLKETELGMEYALSTQLEVNTRSALVTGYTFIEHKCTLANEIKDLTSGIEINSKILKSHLENMGTTKDFQSLLSRITEGNSEQSDQPVFSRAKVWEVNKRAQKCIYEGWKGDSCDAQMFKDVLKSFSERKYFQNSQELNLIASTGVREYLSQMDASLEKYVEELKIYETYDGILNDSYYFKVKEGTNEKEIAGQGFQALVDSHRKWIFSASQKALFLEELNSFSDNLTQIINCYDTNGVYEGQMDAVLLQKIKIFKTYLGDKNSTDSSTYIGKVSQFKTYDSTENSKNEYLYKVQSEELKAINTQYESGKINFEEYKQAIDKLPLRDGPLDDYIQDLRDYLSYQAQLEIYQKSLLNLKPKEYAYFNGAWTLAGSLTQEQLDTAGGIYYRLINGYDKYGNPIYIEDADPDDSISDPVYISASSLWHGDYSHYGIIFRLMAILYEKFTTQKNLLEDYLNQIKENNDKVAEANKYLAKLNKVQAQAAKQGGNANVVIPADVIMFFAQKGISMPTDYFSNKQDLTIYENSDFYKRMQYLTDNNADISSLLSYVAQGKLKKTSDEASSMMLKDISDRDLLELGSLKYIYDKTDYASINFKDMADKVKSKSEKAKAGIIIAIGCAIGPVAGVVAIATAATINKKANSKYKIQGDSVSLYGTDKISAGSKNTLLEAYWANRMEIKSNDESAPIKSVLGYFNEALFNKMKKDDLPSAYPDAGVVTNSLGSGKSPTNGFQLNGWAPLANDWSGSAHYKKLAGQMGDVSNTSEDNFKDGSTNQHITEMADMFAHQKYYGQSKGFSENFTEPDYDYDAIILMYKLEALANVFGDDVATLAVEYLSNRISGAQLYESLESLTDSSRAYSDSRVYSSEEIKQIKAYIDGDNLFTDNEDVQTFEKYTLMQQWTAKPDIKRVLNQLYGNGNDGLNADEVSLWSENMRTYIDKLTTDGQTLSTKMQRMMQRCNETTSLATQMLKSLGDMMKQVAGNIR